MRKQTITQTIFSALFAAMLLPSGLRAQSLDQQYQFYLGDRCREMQFAREGFLDFVSPGQASQAMTDFCSRLQFISGGNITIGQTASGAGSAVSAAGGAEDNAAVRRRRQSAREETTSIDNETSLPLSSNLSLFFSIDYQEQEQRNTEFSGGRNGDVAAANLGMDYRFGRSGVIGVALRGEQLEGDYDAGGDFESRSYGATLFGSWFPTDSLFIDASATGNVKENESRRFVSLTRLRRNTFTGIEFVVVDIPEARADSAFDAAEFGGDIRLGYDFHVGRFTFGPRIAARYRETKIDEYIEQGETIMKLIFDESKPKNRCVRRPACS